MLVIAGPGSGKTAVIVERMFRLITVSGVEPSHILTVTFSRAAAEEMEERFRSIPGMQYTHPSFGTFHSIFFRILISSGYCSSSSLISDKEKQDFFYNKAAVYFPDKNSEDTAEEIMHAVSGIRSLRNCSKNNSDAYRTIAEEYSRYLKNRKLLDFDDIITKTLRLFNERPDVLEQWQNKYRYILIDEFQDISPAQYRTISMLSRPDNNVFAVCDDDQSIYGFRGASPDSVRQFIRDHPGLSHVILYNNYRCCSVITDPAFSLISRNRNRIEKRFVSCRRTQDASFSIDVYQDRQSQYQSVASKIREYKSKGTPLNDMAVLLRSTKDCEIMRNTFDAFGIRYRFNGVISFGHDHFIFKDVCAYLKSAHDPYDYSALICILNRPERHISRNFISFSGNEPCILTLKRAHSVNPGIIKELDRLENDLSFLRLLPPGSAVCYILKAIGYEKYIRDYCSADLQKFRICEKILKELSEQSATFNSAFDLIVQESISSVIKRNTGCAKKYYQ
ncbi:MAG: ATP-dependent helicase, partial [Parasporobacterium sp.]|nr:ATP-dependent helicase [Parasporobacterium sp.]